MIVAHNRIRWFRAPAPNSCRFNEESTTIYWELSTIRPQFSLHSSHSLSLSLIQTIRNFRLRRTFEHGLMYHERKRWHAKQPQCVRQIQPKDLQVSTCNVWCKLWHTHKKRSLLVHAIVHMNGNVSVFFAGLDRYYRFGIFCIVAGLGNKCLFTARWECNMVL